MLKGTEFCLCRRGKGVFMFGYVGRVVFNGSEFCVNSVEFTGCLYWWFWQKFVFIVVSLVVLKLLLLWWLVWPLSSRSIGVFTVCDEKNVPSSNNVELKSVSAVSWIQVSISCEWITVSIFSIVDASRDVCVLWKVCTSKWLIFCVVVFISILLLLMDSFCIISDSTSVIQSYLGTKLCGNQIQNFGGTRLDHKYNVMFLVV